jgi:hypothetical protein
MAILHIAFTEYPDIVSVSATSLQVSPASTNTDVKQPTYREDNSPDRLDSVNAPTSRDHLLTSSGRDQLTQRDVYESRGVQVMAADETRAENLSHVPSEVAQTEVKSPWCDDQPIICQPSSCNGARQPASAQSDYDQHSVRAHDDQLVAGSHGLAQSSMPVAGKNNAKVTTNVGSHVDE